MEVAAFTGCSDLYATDTVTPTGSEHYLKSPNYPDQYPNDFSECWHIHSMGTADRIHITFLDLNLEAHITCAYDALEFQEDNSLGYSLGTLAFCDRNNLPEFIVSTGERISVRFRSDDSVSRTGFSISYRNVPGESEDAEVDCTYLMATHNNQRYLNSPGYPSTYPGNSNVCWTIQSVSWLDIVELRVVTVDIEGNYPSRGCNEDLLQVYDGSDPEHAPLLMTVCNGTPYPDIVYSSGDTLHIRFTADNYGANYGFELSYRSIEYSSIHMSNLAWWAILLIMCLVVCLLLTCCAILYWVKRRRGSVQPGSFSNAVVPEAPRLVDRSERGFPVNRVVPTDLYNRTSQSIVPPPACYAPSSYN